MATTAQPAGPEAERLEKSLRMLAQGRKRSACSRAAAKLVAPSPYASLSGPIAIEAVNCKQVLERIDPEEVPVALPPPIATPTQTWTQQPAGPAAVGAIRVVHIVAPKVIKTDADNFRALVQRLTGRKPPSMAKLEAASTSARRQAHSLKKPVGMRSSSLATHPPPADLSMDAPAAKKPKLEMGADRHDDGGSSGGAASFQQQISMLQHHWQDSLASSANSGSLCDLMSPRAAQQGTEQQQHRRHYSYNSDNSGSSLLECMSSEAASSLQGLLSCMSSTTTVTDAAASLGLSLNWVQEAAINMIADAVHIRNSRLLPVPADLGDTDLLAELWGSQQLGPDLALPPPPTRSC